MNDAIDLVPHRQYVDQATPYLRDPHQAVARRAVKSAFVRDEVDAAFEGDITLAPEGQPRPIVYGACVMSPLVIDAVRWSVPVILHGGPGSDPESRTMAADERLLLTATLGDGVTAVRRLVVDDRPLPLSWPFVGDDPSWTAARGVDSAWFDELGTYRLTRSRELALPLDVADVEQVASVPGWAGLGLAVGSVGITVAAAGGLGWEEEIEGSAQALRGLPGAPAAQQYVPTWEWGAAGRTLQGASSVSLANDAVRRGLIGAPGQSLMVGRSDNPLALTYWADSRFVPDATTTTFVARRQRDASGDRDRLVWQRVTWEAAQPLRQPCLLRMLISARQYARPGTQRVEVTGSHVRVPSNTRVLDAEDSWRLEFIGDWDGELTDRDQFTPDPAWVLLDLLTQPQWGLGLDRADIDLVTFVEASRRNNELLPGTTLPRYAWHGPITVAAAAREVIDTICSVMHAQLVRERGKWRLVQDRPASGTPDILSPAVVAGGIFRYSDRSAPETPFSSVRVVARGNEIDTLDAMEWTWTDAAVVDQTGWRELEIAWPSQISDQAYAAQAGRWQLETLARERQVVTFSQPLTRLVTGQIVRILDAARTWRRSTPLPAAGQQLVGRIVSAENNQYGLDGFELAGAAEDDLQLWFELSSGWVWIPSFSRIETTIIPDLELPVPPKPGAGWALLDPAAADDDLWRIVSIAETGTDYAVTAVQHDPRKYAVIDAATAAAAVPPSPTVTVPPQFEVPRLESGRIVLRFQAAAALASQTRFQIVARQTRNDTGPGEDWTGQIVAPQWSRAAEPGIWEFTLWHTQDGQRVGPPSQQTLVVAAPPLQPVVTPTAFRQSAFAGDRIILNHQGGSGFDVLVTRFSSTSQRWNVGLNEERHAITPGFEGRPLPLERAHYGAGFVMLRGLDTATNRWGDVTIAAVTAAPDEVPRVLIETVNEHPSWSGATSDLVKDGSLLTLPAGPLPQGTYEPTLKASYWGTNQPSLTVDLEWRLERGTETLFDGFPLMDTWGLLDSESVTLSDWTVDDLPEIASWPAPSQIDATLDWGPSVVIEKVLFGGTGQNVLLDELAGQFDALQGLWDNLGLVWTPLGKLRLAPEQTVPKLRVLVRRPNVEVPTGAILEKLSVSYWAEPLTQEGNANGTTNTDLIVVFDRSYWPGRVPEVFVTFNQAIPNWSIATTVTGFTITTTFATNRPFRIGWSAVGVG